MLIFASDVTIGLYGDNVSPLPGAMSGGHPSLQELAVGAADVP